MERRRLGHTDFQASVAILGGAAFAGVTARQAHVCLEFALSKGINRLDLTPTDGTDEEVIGEAMPEFRKLLFVSGNSRRRNPTAMRRQMVFSLKTLRLDHFDLYQAHGVDSVAELDARGGAIEELLRDRSEGIVRHVGITGHDLGAPAAHLQALARYDLDSVMFPIYPRMWAETAYRRDVELLLAECAKRGVGVQVSRALARRPWADTKAAHIMPYEPHTSPYSIQRAVNFVLSIEGVHGFCTPGDLSLLPTVLDAARSYTPMDRDQRAAVMSSAWSGDLINPPSDTSLGERVAVASS